MQLARFIAVLEPSAMPGARVHRLYEAGDACEIVLPPMSSQMRSLDKLLFVSRMLQSGFWNRPGICFPVPFVASTLFGSQTLTLGSLSRCGHRELLRICVGARPFTPYEWQVGFPTSWREAELLQPQTCELRLALAS